MFSSYLINEPILSLDSRPIERLTKLLNDTFDVLNGRSYKERITILNWHDMTELPHEQPGKTKVGKKFILDQMLDVLDQTEEIYKDTGSRIKMFASITTIRGWRLSDRSAIALIEEQFNAGFDFVLTGKWNQDPLEVCI